MRMKSAMNYVKSVLGSVIRGKLYRKMSWNWEKFRLPFIALSRNLNMKVLAEGVERKEQLDKLAEYKCDEIQGYLFSPPLSAVEVLGAFLGLSV
jgi:EAL domain-containing protein (putative c-di-GMP-specific phosphodiesterase class I)